MADFTELKVQSGVGDYHFNRFRVAFRKPPGIFKEFLAQDFATHFPIYLTSQFANVVFEAGRTFDGKPTLHFHGYMKHLGIDLARPHTDWVVRHWFDPNVGFTAQTLKREFFDSTEDAAAASGGGIIGDKLGGPLGGAVGAAAAVHYNRMHFLAGRRSWRLDNGTVFGLTGDLLVLETIAVERFSAEFFAIGDKLAGLEKSIPDIWITNLNQFLTLKNLDRVPQPAKARWKNKNGVDFIQIALDDLPALRADIEFVDAYRLYPTIIDLSP